MNLQTLKEVLKLATQSKRGFIAFVIIVLSGVAILFFKTSPSETKFQVFVMLYIVCVLGLLLFGMELIISSKRIKKFGFNRKKEWQNSTEDRSVVFSQNPLPGRVFAIEILEDALVLEKKKKSIELAINRDNATKAIYNNQGKKNLAKAIFENDPEAIKFAKNLDLTLHDFVLNKNKTKKIIVDLRNFPLRWTSGGVFAIVEYQGRKWTPFFFRDIKPFGWNIPLGASESFVEVENPMHLIWREFIEEFLIVKNKPNSKETNKIRKPNIPKIHNFEFTVERAKQLMDKHIGLRERCDGLGFEIDDQDVVNFELDGKKKNSVIVSSTCGCNTKIDNVLFAINPFEQGIEIVSVIHFKLNPNNYILDGEIMEPEGKEKELVRMPVALISHDYLKKVFAKKEKIFDYYDNLDINDSKAFIQNSVNLKNIDEKDIIAFNWDVGKRKAIINQKIEGVGTEYDRFTQWNEYFGSHFCQNPDLPRTMPGLFTPASAKIASYYFSLK